MPVNTSPKKPSLARLLSIGRRYPQLALHRLACRRNEQFRRVLQSKVHQPETEPPVRSLTLQGFEINNVADVSINKLFATEETKKTDSEN
jgi:hypothetical protein